MFSNQRPPVALAALAVAVALAGCTPVDPGFGEALKYDMAVQTIDPDPVYAASDAKPGDSGVKAQKATERYRRDQVKKVETIGTTSGVGGGGSN